MSSLADAFLADIGTPTRPARRPGGRPPKHMKSRQRKLECPACGFICYATAGAVNGRGFPSCACGAGMVAPNLRDQLAFDATYDDAVASLVGMSRRVRREELTRAGWSREEISGFNDHYEPRPDAFNAKPANQCQWDGGYCRKFTSGRFCPEHDPYNVGHASRAVNVAAL